MSDGEPDDPVRDVDSSAAGMASLAPSPALSQRPTLSPAWAARLRALTPARVGLERTGVSLETRDLLDFQRSHAQARDAVHSKLESAALAVTIAATTSGSVLRLHSAAKDRATYLQRPDLGRMLDEASKQQLLEYASRDHSSENQTTSSSIVLIIADGLSALAVERHAAPLIQELLPHLANWTLAPVCIVEQARVAIGDEIGVTLGARVSVVLIGERPGLSSPDSLGAYITWEPRAGRTDAERNCISNIRGEGLSYTQAASQLGYYLKEARRRQLTGVNLKEEAPGIEDSGLRQQGSKSLESEKGHAG